MARVAPSYAVFISLLFLLTLSRARDLPNPFPEPKPESEPATHQPQPHDTVSFTIDSIDPVPLTLLRFRPINRHFHPGRPLPLELPLSLRTGHRRCRHGHRREIPYGNDAIVLSDAARQIHPRWARFHSAAEPRFPATVEIHDSDHERRHQDEHHRHHHHRREENWFAKKIGKFMNLF